jgi:hypothetical protein
MLHFGQRFVAADRHDFRRGAPGFGKAAAASGLAKAMEGVATDTSSRHHSLKRWPKPFDVKGAPFDVTS